MSFCHLPYEFQMLIWSLKSISKPRNADEFCYLFQNKVNWENFINLVDWHRVTPIIFRMLSENYAEYIPSSDMADLKANFEKNSVRVMKMTQELAHIAKAFHQENLSFISLKGPMLARRIYGAVVLREPRDLDLLILLKDFPIAHQILMAKGYQLYSPNRPKKNLSFYAKYQKDISYFHPKKNMMIELHWRLFNNPYDFTYPISRIFEEVEFESLLGLTMAKMPVELELLYLLHHGQKHSWSRLCWLYDVKQYFHCYPSIHPHHLQWLARRAGVEHSVMTGLALIHQLWDSSLHSDIPRYFEKKTAIQSSTNYSIHIMSQSTSPSLWMRWRMLINRFPRERQSLLFYKAFFMRLILRAIHYIPA